MTNEIKSPLSGIIPPLVTPLLGNDTLDVASLENLIDHLIAGGVHGLFILGTTGEEQSLSYPITSPPGRPNWQSSMKTSCPISPSLSSSTTCPAM